MTAHLFDRICFRLCVAELWLRDPPEWFRISRNVIGGFLVILLIAFCFFAIAVMTPDTQY